jgi:hypothetical protein
MFTEVEKAKMVATWAHRNQTDMAGRPYIEHCERVARAVSGNDVAVAVAWLHDVVEDTDLTYTDLEKLGFSYPVLAGVAAITQLPGEPLEEYWGRVRENGHAKLVKTRGDIPDNLDERRLDFLPEKIQVKLRDKYARAVNFLGLPVHENGETNFFRDQNR